MTAVLCAQWILGRWSQSWPYFRVSSSQ